MRIVWLATISLVLGVLFLVPTLYAQTSTKATDVSITIGGTATTVSGGSGGGGRGPADVVFKGFAYPGATMTFLRDNSVIGTVVAGTDGLFEKTISTNSGLVNFGIWAKDKIGLISSTVRVSLSFSKNTTVEISQIFVSPTISAGRKLISKGATIRLFGASFPGSIVRIFNDISPNTPEAEVVADSQTGQWEYVFDTDDIIEGTYIFSSNAQIPELGLVSPFSEEITFTLLELNCSGADFNFDGNVNITDFSIMLFYWGGPPDKGELVNLCTDLNSDGLVNIYDFSILMFDWTG